MPRTSPGAVLHYVGYDVDRGGILAVIRALATEPLFSCVLGVNPAFAAQRSRGLALLRLPAIDGDTISAATFGRALVVARAVQVWLRQDSSRVFHGHSRGGLLVALWLRLLGERQVVVTVHCYGRQRWFYRWAERWLRDCIFWLSPAMKAHYGLANRSWGSCLPPCLPEATLLRRRPRDEAPVCFGCVGGLVPVKKWELALEALARIPRDVPVRVIHAGGEIATPAGRAYAARLRTRAAQPDVAGRFAWRGEVGDMAAFYREIDCLLIASSHEAFSVAALEAAQHGVPTLAANAAGNPDLISTARLGGLFTANDADACARRMSDIAAGHDLRDWQPDETALRRFSAATVAAQHADVYRRVIGA